MIIVIYTPLRGLRTMCLCNISHVLYITYISNKIHCAGYGVDTNIVMPYLICKLYMSLKNKFGIGTGIDV